MNQFFESRSRRSALLLTTLWYFRAVYLWHMGTPFQRFNYDPTNTLMMPFYYLLPPLLILLVCDMLGWVLAPRKASSEGVR